MLKFISIIVGSLLIASSFATNKAPQMELVEGKDYTILTSPVQKSIEPNGKINVKEFFSYTCIHCKDIEPLIEQSLIPNKSINLNKIQVVWSDQAEVIGFAKLAATIEILKLQKLNIPAFNAIFSHQDLNNQKTLKKFLGQNGLNSADVDKFIATYNSFSISGKVGEYKNQTASYNITGTPTFVVADKYVASPAVANRLINVVQALVNKAKLDEQNKK